MTTLPVIILEPMQRSSKNAAAAEDRTAAVAAVLATVSSSVVVPQASAVAPRTTTAVAARVGGRVVPSAHRRGQAEVYLCTGLVVVLAVVVVVLLLPVARAQGLPMVVEALHAAIAGSGHALLPSAGRRQRCRWLGVAPAVAMVGMGDHRF